MSSSPETTKLICRRVIKLVQTLLIQRSSFGSIHILARPRTVLAIILKGQTCLGGQCAVESQTWSCDRLLQASTLDKTHTMSVMRGGMNMERLRAPQGIAGNLEENMSIHM